LRVLPSVAEMPWHSQLTEVQPGPVSPVFGGAFCSTPLMHSNEQPLGAQVVVVEVVLVLVDVEVLVEVLVEVDVLLVLDVELVELVLLDEVVVWFGMQIVCSRLQVSVGRYGGGSQAHGIAPLQLPST
jgi:hypothetical protein